jgi:integrase
MIPAERMKAKRAHRVPLSDRAMAILKEAKTLKSDKSDLVFPGMKETKALSDMTLSKLMKDLGISAVPHGFRSSFRDWAGETTAHPREVIEFALAHVIQNKAEAAYARSDLLDKRRALMRDWAIYLK